MKRGILVLLVLVLFSSFALATVDLTLDRDKFGPAQNLEGFIEIQMEQPLPIDTDLKLIIDGKTYTKNISEVFELISGEELLPMTYQAAGSSRQQEVIDSSQAFEKVYGFDLSNSQANKWQDLFEIQKLTLRFKGENNNQFPSTPSLDLGNDNSYEYSYVGPLQTGYNSIDSTSYLGTGTIESEKGIRGNQQDIYCQKIKIHPSQKFKIEANVKKVIAAVKPLKAAIIDPDEGILPDCSVPGVPCCTLAGITNNIQTKASCEINYRISEEKDYLVCLFIPDADISLQYNLAVDTETQNKQGYYGLNQEAQRNFFIYVSWAKYQTTLQNSIEIPDLKDKANEYLQSCNSDDCLLMPFKVKTSSPGKLSIDNIQLVIDTVTGPETITSFKPVDFLQERIKYPQKFTVPLSFFEDALTPSKKDEDYSVQAVLSTQSSQTKKFDVVEVADVNIDYSPSEPTLGDLITFSAIVQPTEGKTIQLYAWDFGNGTESTISSIQKSFSEAKEYTVKLTVTDSSGLKSSKSIKFSLSPLEETLEYKLNTTIQRLNELKQEIVADSNLKSIYDSLGYSTLIEQGIGNITLLQVRYNSIDNSSNTSQAQYTLINQELVTILDSLPGRSGTSKASFNSKITSLDEIPSAFDFGLEEIEQFKERAYLAQESVSIPSEASLIKIQFMSGRISRYILVKKTITGSGEIYEMIPSQFSIKEVLTPNYEIIAPYVYKWASASEISYILDIPEDLESTALTSVTESKTLVLPSDLSSISLETEQAPVYTIVCGDKICSLSEDQTCPQDCKQKKQIPWIIIIILVLITGLGIYYFNFYKGKYNFQDLMNKKQKLFKSQKDLDAVTQYIKVAKQKGMLDIQIKMNLRKKGWTQDQVDEAFKWSKK